MLLLDTHVLLWLLDDPARKMPVRTRRLLADPDTRIIVSTSVVWEISIKRSLGKLEAPGNLLHLLEHAAVPTLPITASHAERAGSLPDHHRDPFDRMLIAQAQIEGLPIVTADPVFGEYGVETVWN